MWLMGLVLVIGLVAAVAIYRWQVAAGTPTEAEAEQVILEQWERTFDAEAQTFEGALVVKLQPHLIDEPYAWHEHSPLAVWKYAAGDLSPTTLDDLERANRDQEVEIVYFSMQSRGDGEIVVRVASYYPVTESSGFSSGGYGVTWRLARDAAGWGIAAYEDEFNWDMVAVP